MDRGAARERIMATSGISAAGAYTPNQQIQQIGQHKHGKHQSSLMSDIDAQGSSVSTAPSSTGKVGKKVDITI
jgi:hypothetical protein